jgi:hypothetical protein
MITTGAHGGRGAGEGLVAAESGVGAAGSPWTAVLGFAAICLGSVNESHLEWAHGTCTEGVSGILCG